ncbi:MAG TPA: hypothetical protein DEG71_03885 [Clostridiales bacterium]|nr:hypothetical protein [Clostridiales bacterium]
MILNVSIYILIALFLLFIAYKDFRERIIPDLWVLLIFIISSLYFFINKGQVAEYFFFIYLASMPIFVLSYILDSMLAKQVNKVDYGIILVSVVVGLFVPFDYKLKYITACSIFLLLIFVHHFLTKKEVVVEESGGMSIGGGDIKLIAALGPILQMQMLGFLFITFLCAYLFMKIRRENTIYLAPFMFISFIITGLLISI